MIIVIKLNPTSSSYQKVLKKFNNIVIARLIISYQANILSNTCIFHTTTNQKTLRKEFETWPAVSIPNATLLTFDIQIINLGYLDDGLFCFTELPNSSTKQLNRTLRGLHNTAVILDNNNKHSPDLLNSKDKWAKKKSEKAQRCQQRNLKLAQAIFSASVDSSSFSFIAINSFLSALAADDNFLSVIASDGFLSAIVGENLLSAVAGGSSLSFIAGDASLFHVLLLLCQPNILFHMAHCSLISLLAIFARFPCLYTKKKLFDHAFIS